MQKLYLVDLKFTEETVLYELVPQELGRMKEGTAKELVHALQDLGARKVVLDTAIPEAADILKQYNFEVLRTRL